MGSGDIFILFAMDKVGCDVRSPQIGAETGATVAL